MIASSIPDFPQLVQDFFCQYLVNQRNVSGRTVASYRDTFCLFLRFLESHLGKSPTQLLLNDLNVTHIETFLHYLEKERNNSIRTRNNRLAAIRSFLKYAAGRDPTMLPTIQQALAMPMKRFDRVQVGFMSRREVEAILDAPDRSTWSGRRDCMMFAMLYNTGARVSELAGLRLRDVSLARSGSVLIHGKGRKERTIPLWKTSVRQLKRWIKEIDSDDQQPLFPNANGEFLSRSGVEYRLKRAVSVAALKCPSLTDRSISPHTMRHTTAMHLLQSGVDITVIALWLGHESPATTHMYVEADLTMKEHALGRLQEPRTRSYRYQPGDKLIQFLEGL